MQNDSEIIDLENQADEKEAINQIFSPIKGMKKIVGIERDGKKAGVYACRMQESTTKNTSLILIIKYLNGSYSPTFKVKVTDLKLGYEDCKYNKKSVVLKEMEDYSLCELEISYNELFYVLCRVYKTLPIKTFTKKIPIPQIYSIIMNTALNNEEKQLNDYSVKDGSYNLTSDEIRGIAEEAGYSIDELMDEMVSYELLIKDSDTKRYQRTIRSKTFGVKKVYSFKTPEAYRERIEKTVEVDDLPAEEVEKIKKGFKALREIKLGKNVMYPYE